MELFDVTFKTLDLALGAAGKRQEVLANNLSNVNTPGYKRLDVDFDGALKKAVEAARNGNSVDVDQEMAFLAENNIRYNALVQLTQKKLETLKYVISDGRR
jgi:flagellar basal-body rod protein FlgB